jgi:ketosteroid isomerase-like protein
MVRNRMSLRWKERAKNLGAAAVLTAFGLTAVSALSATESSALETAIVDVIQRQAEAWNRGDLEGFMDGYLKGSGLVFTSGSQVRRGWQITYDKYEQRYGTSPETMGNLRFSDLEVHQLGDTSAWVLGRWDLAAPDTESGGIFTLVMQRLDGNWVVVHDHTSSDPAD